MTNGVAQAVFFPIALGKNTRLIGLFLTKLNLSLYGQSEWERR